MCLPPMSASSACLLESLPCHSGYRDIRRRVKVRTAPSSPLSGPSAGCASAPLPPATATYPTLGSSRHISQSGSSFPSMLFVSSSSSHPPTFASRRQLVPGPQHLVHRVPAVTDKSGSYPQYLYPSSSPSLPGESLSTFHQSSNNPLGSPMTSLPRLAPSPTKGSVPLYPRNGLVNNSTVSSSHGTTLKESTSLYSSRRHSQLNYSDSSFSTFLPSSPTASQTSSSRTSSPCLFNKSIQTLLRRGKSKQTKLGAYPSLPSLTINSKVDEVPRVHKTNSSQSLAKAAIFSSAHARSEAPLSCRSSSSVQSFNSYPQLHLTRNAYSTDQRTSSNCPTTESSLKSARSFYSNADSDGSYYSPLATPTFCSTSSCLSQDDLIPRGCQTAIFTGSLPVPDKIKLPDDRARVKISTAHPAAKSTPALKVTQESDEDDSEVEDIMANLRNIAASKSSSGQHWTSDSHSLLQKKSMDMSIHSDQHWTSDSHSLLQKKSMDMSIHLDQDSGEDSDNGSVFSLDAASDEEEGPDHFPLPSWPALTSTSQSPLDK